MFPAVSVKPLFLSRLFSLTVSLLQSMAQCTEYNDILDKAAQETDSLKRLALVSTNGITGFAFAEKGSQKPVNPLLDETFELITENYSFLAEQVSHHPSVAATYCRGKHYT